jgi:LDH2 family malate/lactate/ureidoglycolate dehydrogenase
MAEQRFAETTLRAFACEALGRRGVSDAHAADVAGTLVATSLRGVDTHGIRLLPCYLRMLDTGKAIAAPILRFEERASALHVLDAGGALGPVAALAAVRHAGHVARATGIAVVSARNSRHFGPAGHFARELAALGFIGLVCSNADALVAPHQGIAAMFGTNPIAIAAPAAGGSGFYLDMATSQVSFSRVQLAAKAGLPLDPSWAVGPDGRSALGLADIAALRPLGGYKGQGLAMAVEILCAGLSGGAFDHALAFCLGASPASCPERDGVSHFVCAVDIGRFIDRDLFERRLAQLFDDVRAQRGSAELPVMVPGDLERAAYDERSALGIPVPDALREELNALAGHGASRL